MIRCSVLVLLTAVVGYSSLDAPNFAGVTWVRDAAKLADYNIFLKWVLDKNDSTSWHEVDQFHEKTVEQDWQRFCKRFRQLNKNQSPPDSRPPRVGEGRVITMYSFVSACVQMGLIDDSMNTNPVQSVSQEVVASLETVHHIVTDFGGRNRLGIHDLSASGSSAANGGCMEPISPPPGHGGECTRYSRCIDDY